MARKSFTSFHYQYDYWRVQQVLQMGAIEGTEIMPAQNWESIKAKGDAAVEAWIDREMAFKAAVVVLVGSQTASRKFVKYEIRRAWSIKKPLVGIRIHGLKDADKNTSTAGVNPFKQFGFTDSDKTYADYVPLFEPAGATSTEVYASIKSNLGTWAASGYSRP